MKYIDVEKLRAEIEVLKRKKGFLPFENTEITEAYMARGVQFTCDDIVKIIQSLQQERPKEICHKCVYHGKDDDYCYCPHLGMQRQINENGVYDCTGFYETEQEQSEVDLEKELDKFYGMYRKDGKTYDIKDGEECVDWKEMFNPYAEIEFAQHFFNLGLNARKK